MRTVRLATEADAAGILAVYAPYIRDTAITFETEIPSLNAFRRRMASIIGDYPYLVVEEDGSIVGFAYAHRLGERAAYAWNAELSIYFAPGYTSRGWGSVLFWALIDLLALQGVRNAYSLITVPNEASLALHEKLALRSWAFRRRPATSWAPGTMWRGCAWPSATSQRLPNPACRFPPWIPIRWPRCSPLLRTRWRGWGSGAACRRDSAEADAMATPQRSVWESAGNR